METHRHTQTHGRGQVGKLVPCTFSVSLPGSQKTCILWATSQLPHIGQGNALSRWTKPCRKWFKGKGQPGGRKLSQTDPSIFQSLTLHINQVNWRFEKKPLPPGGTHCTLPQGKSLIINYLAYKWCTIKTQSHVIDFESTCFVSRYICFKPPFPKN